MTTPDELERLIEQLEETERKPWGKPGEGDYNDVPVHVMGPKAAKALRLLRSERAELLDTVERMRGTIEMANNIANGYYTSYEFDAEDTVRRLIDVLSGEDK